MTLAATYNQNMNTTANNALFEMWALSLYDLLNAGFAIQMYAGAPPADANEDLTTANTLLGQVNVPANELTLTDATISKVASPAAWEDQSANDSGVPTFCRITANDVVIQCNVGKQDVVYPPDELPEVLITVPDTLDYAELGIMTDLPYIVAGGFIAIDTLAFSLGG